MTVPQFGPKLEIKISVTGMIDELFSRYNETVPTSEVATSHIISVYLLASSLCLRNAEGGISLCLPRLSHGFQSKTSTIWKKHIIIFSLSPSHKHEPLPCWSLFSVLVSNRVCPAIPPQSHKYHNKHTLLNFISFLD